MGAGESRDGRKATSRRVCPICASDALPRAENAAFPFCSPRCKLVDLGRWLDGGYRVPGPDDMSEDIDSEDS